MIGLVLGDTQLGKLIIKKLSRLNKKHIIIDISKKITNAKRESKKYSIFSHYKELTKIL